MNHNISYQIFEEAEQPKAVMFIIHGMQEHKERYESFARYCNQHQIICLTCDLPGHGQSIQNESEKGWFGETDGWKNLVETAHFMASLAKEKYPDLPVIYFGHSMGTLVARVYLQQYDDEIDAMILSGAPNYNPGCKLGKWIAQKLADKRGGKGKSKLLDLLATGSFNKAVKNPKTPVDWLSYNTENITKYICDPMCGFPFTIHGYYDLFTLMEKMHEKDRYEMKHADLPIFFIAGCDDPCIGGEKGFENSIQFLKDAGYQNVDKHLFDHMRHEILQEKDAETVMKTIVNWLDEHFLK